MLLQIVVHLSVHHLLCIRIILKCALRSLPPCVDLILGQRQLLFHIQAIGLHLGPTSISNIRAGSPLINAFLSQGLHLVIQILLLV